MSRGRPELPPAGVRSGALLQPRPVRNRTRAAAARRRELRAGGTRALPPSLPSGSGGFSDSPSPAVTSAPTVRRLAQRHRPALVLVRGGRGDLLVPFGGAERGPGRVVASGRKGRASCPAAGRWDPAGGLTAAALGPSRWARGWELASCEALRNGDGAVPS